jgi:hypothetical protein
VQTSTDPEVVKLIHEHSRSVDRFVKEGNGIIGEEHPLPPGYSRPQP